MFKTVPILFEEEHDDRGGPGYDDRGGPGYDDRGGPGYDDRGGPGYDDRGGPGYDDRGGPGYDDRGGHGYRSDNPRSSPKLFMNYFSHRMFSAQFDCTGLLGVINSCTY